MCVLGWTPCLSLWGVPSGSWVSSLGSRSDGLCGVEVGCRWGSLCLLRGVTSPGCVREGLCSYRRPGKNPGPRPSTRPLRFPTLSGSHPARGPERGDLEPPRGVLVLPPPSLFRDGTRHGGLQTQIGPLGDERGSDP